VENERTVNYGNNGRKHSRNGYGLGQCPVITEVFLSTLRYENGYQILLLISFSILLGAQFSRVRDEEVKNKARMTTRPERLLSGRCRATKLN